MNEYSLILYYNDVHFIIFSVGIFLLECVSMLLFVISVSYVTLPLEIYIHSLCWAAELTCTTEEKYMHRLLLFRKDKRHSS